MSLLGTAESPSYLFNFQQMRVEVPYTDYVFTTQAPVTYYMTFGSCLVYALLIYVIFPMFTPSSDEGKARLKTYAKFHHTCLFVYSALSFSVALYYLVSSGEMFDFTSFLCTPVPAWLRCVSLSFIVSKIFEWPDTAIDIWKGKSVARIGFLHCYHHSTTFFLFLLIENFPGLCKSGMLMNGFVHSLMYYHYAFRLPKFMRPIITAAQLAQLISSTWFWHVTPDVCPDLAYYRAEHFLEFCFPYVFVPVYTLFFMKFFYETYIKAPAPSSEKKKA
jgi:hypothetical protein